MFHDIDIINIPIHTVCSKFEGPNIGIQHHGQGANRNLYTEIYCGSGGSMGLQDGRNIHNETYWGIHSDTGDTYDGLLPYTQANAGDHVSLTLLRQEYSR